MQVICISRGTLGGGRELAERLAKKLGCACLGREELIEAAIQEGIQVGKLEMAMVKPRIFSEQLARERDYYLAFTTAYLCDRVMKERLVYHGRTGHLLLPGVDHVLRVRVVSDQEQRIRRVIRDLGLDRTRARKYLQEVDEDRQRWARSMYGIGWEDAANYDLVMNLQHLSVENAAAALTAVAELPDFQMTPASQRAMLDLRLAARSRVALARHEQTSGAKFKVRADADVVTVTFLPQDSRYAEFIPVALASVADIGEVRATMAETNILWVQERFDPASETYQQVAELATKWNAAVELFRLAPKEAAAPGPQQPSELAPEAAATGQYNGGIEDDVDEPDGAAVDDGGVKRTLDALAGVGLSGGSAVAYGEAQELIGTMDCSRSCSLVVIGDLFLAKGHEARLRMTRDLERFVGEHVTAPVVGADELKSQYLFGGRDVARLAGFLALVAALFALVFSNQNAVLKFVSGQWASEGFFVKCAAAAAVFLFVPVIAHSYGTVAKSLMKLIKME